jgi:orotidine-5'-phosphate decarboxylase
VDDLAAAWRPGRAAALVTASRSIARAHEERGGTPERAARAAAGELRAAAWSAST